MIFLAGWTLTATRARRTHASGLSSAAYDYAVHGVSALEACRSSCPSLCEVDYQAAGGRIDAHWHGFADPQSSIVRYQWAIGSGPRPSQQLMPFVDVGLNTSGTCPPAAFSTADGNCPALCTYTAAKPAVAFAAAIPGFCSNVIYSTEYDCLSARNSWTAAVPRMSRRWQLRPRAARWSAAAQSWRTA